MEGEKTASGEGRDSSDGGEDSVNTQLKDGYTAGDSIWIKLHGDSWWPAQVVNEDSISRSCKPRKKSGELVLVRLYGSYDYLYVDPVKSHSDFIMVLQKNNGSHREVFKKALKKVSRNAGSHVEGSKSTESKRTDPSKDKKRLNTNQSKQNAAKRKNYSKCPRAHNIEKSKASLEDASEMKSKRKNHSENPDEDCIAKRKPSRQSSLKRKASRQGSLQMKATKDRMKVSEQVNKLNNRSNVKDKAGSRAANENGTSKTLKRKRSSYSDVRDVMQKKLKEDNQNNKNVAKQKLESPRGIATSSGRFPELSARRIKVMQSLGLIAPTGSPYQKHRI